MFKTCYLFDTELQVIEENNIVDELANCGWKSKLEMSFNSKQAAYDFYNTYRGKGGFSIRKAYANKNKHTKEITYGRLYVTKREVGVLTNEIHLSKIRDKR